MPKRAQRGLGLLVIGLPCWWIGLRVDQNAESVGADVAGVLFASVGVVCTLVGLVMLAVGLLRD